MDRDPLSSKLDHSESPKNQQPSKKRKVVEKTVVTVKIGTNAIGKLKNEGPPSDSWSWRKYGQKPIKGSPHPRGYYRCSTSKGCSAKKQVERCKTDDTLLIITYTSSHNHPGPHDDHGQDQDHNRSSKEEPFETQPINQDSHDHNHNPPSPKQDHQGDNDKASCDFHYINESSVEHCPQDIVSVGVELDQQDTNFTTTTSSPSCGTNTFVLDKELICNFSSSHSQEENDFFDELEELPTYSNFKSFMRSHLSDEIRSFIPIVPS